MPTKPSRRLLQLQLLPLLLLQLQLLRLLLLLALVPFAEVRPL